MDEYEHRDWPERFPPTPQSRIWVDTQDLWRIGESRSIQCVTLFEQHVIYIRNIQCIIFFEQRVVYIRNNNRKNSTNYAVDCWIYCTFSWLTSHFFPLNFAQKRAEKKKRKGLPTVDSLGGALSFLGLPPKVLPWSNVQMAQTRERLQSSFLLEEFVSHTRPYSNASVGRATG